MPSLKTPLEIYKLLPKSNCRECRVSTCMAFAASVIKHEKKLSDCPYLDRSIIARYEGGIERQINLESIQEGYLKELQEKIEAVDLHGRAKKLGAVSNGKSLVIPCLGKDFEIDGLGNVKSQCHTHAWFSIPLLDYVLHSAGEDSAGTWVPFRELENGKKWNPLFEKRCEKPLKQVANDHAELFEDLITMFSGKSSFNNFSSDISVVLYPLPKVPVLICYWKPEDDMESKLHIFFDDTAEKNLPVQSLFTLGTGIVQMLEKIMQKHTDGKSELS